MPNYPAAASPAITVCRHAESQRREVAGRDCWPRRAAKLRRSGIFVERVTPMYTCEPQRGGILLAAGGYDAPTELQPAAGLAVHYKDGTPTELGLAAFRAVGGAANQRPGVGAGWRVLFVFQRSRPRAAQAERWAKDTRS